MEREITWNDLWRMDSQSFKFLIRAVYDVLPSPPNLHRWGLEEQPACPLCEGILEHILSCVKELSPTVIIGGGTTRSSEQ